MNLITDRLEKLIDMKKTVDEGLPEFLTIITDETLALETRWEIYSTLCKFKILVNDEIYGDGHIDVLGNNLTVYDNFYIERHETFDYVDLLERIEQSDSLPKENLREWKEAVLQGGYSSFTYDW